MKTATRNSIALGLIACLSFATPTLAQSLQDLANGQLDGVETWDELCAITDCDQFPVGYSTIVFGPEVYYFPMNSTLAESSVASFGVFRHGRFSEVVDDTTFLRTFSLTGYGDVVHCCDYLLTFFGLLDDFPMLRQTPPASAYTRSLSWTAFSSYDHNRRHHNDVGRLIGIEVEAFPPIEALFPSGMLSYNDDFWIVEANDEIFNGLTGGTYRLFRLISKQPMFHGRHIVGTCVARCTFQSVSLAGSEGETRPHIHMQRLIMTGENMFLCTLEEVANGCDPSPDIMDRVPAIFEVMEDMFEAAQVFPE